jgi:hypothetical protein
MRGRETEEHLGGSGSVESLVGTEVGVIEENELDAPFGFRLGGRKKTKAKKRFCRLPESFDQHYGADLAHAPNRWETEASFIALRKLPEVN